MSETVGKPGRNDEAICSARLSQGGSNFCDITGKLSGNRTVLVFKVGNGGGFASKGDMFLDIDGREVWHGQEVDSGWKHTGWTYRASVAVDVINGTVAPIGEPSSCFNIGDCPN
ncbi:MULTISPECIES: hypothetical protein [Sorangium]|uniref:hypothetical protein n=1 Tax=Sorangium TaxID=39643 RepID=UPI003D9C5D61